LSDAPILRLLTCGSVDDGKSTLIGRLLHDYGLIPEDQLEALRASAGADGRLDFSLLLDGLSAEREQGITIDVAWRYFRTTRRPYILADTPGHEQYTRNMAVGAAQADVAILLVDAARDFRTQTFRHATIAWLFGVRDFVLAVNKMDLASWSEARFRTISARFASFAEGLPGARVSAIPLSAAEGDNLSRASTHMPWYKGPTLIDHLDSLEPLPPEGQQPFRMPVQWVNRAPGFRGFAGRIAMGAVAPGDRVMTAASGAETRVARIVTAEGDLDRAVAGQSITLTLETDLDIPRGAMIAAAEAPVGYADQFEARLLWLGDESLVPGRSYDIRIGPRRVTGRVSQIKYALDPETQAQLSAATLALNQMGAVNLALDESVAFAPYEENRTLGGFIMVDRLTHATLGAGMIRFGLRRAQNIRPQVLDVGREAHAAIKGHRPYVLWFTGLSGSGKSTIANLVERKLHARHRHTVLLDGDNVRHGLNRDLGFTEADRVENIRRVAEVARLMSDAGLIVLVAFISPFRADREMARGRMATDEFAEVFVDTPLAIAEARDVKGLYKKARAGELKNFTGIDSPYEPPLKPAIRIDTTVTSAEDAADLIVAHVLERTGW
jgi:bifunctional enzyme CysN/CysC